MRFLGIYREALHSPNREGDDAKILEAVAENLRLLGAEATTLDVRPALEALTLDRFDVAAPMCEALPTLIQLAGLASRTPFINTPVAVLNCYRTRMVPTLQACEPARYPKTEIRPVLAPLAVPAFMNGVGMWVKRGDVHNTCDHDVVHVQTVDDLLRVREDFRKRGIDQMVMQQHHDGDLVKFYGVGPGKWFTWFYHNPAKALNLPFDVEQLGAQTAAAAAAVGLEVFGGDAIITPEGPIRIIDINSWPSFARVRAEAAPQIAAHLLARANGEPAVAATATEACAL